VIEKQGISTPILFDWNKATIHKDSYSLLEEAAAEMKSDKTITITINGYTDTTGTDDYNKTLSVERAEAVKKHLIGLGISPSRLKIVGHGSKSPAESNNTAEGRKEDRRAIMKVKKAKK
jgi:OOP family OmpA-OmpF porin